MCKFGINFVQALYKGGVGTRCGEGPGTQSHSEEGNPETLPSEKHYSKNRNPAGGGGGGGGFTNPRSRLSGNTLVGASLQKGYTALCRYMYVHTCMCVYIYMAAKYRATPCATGPLSEAVLFPVVCPLSKMTVLHFDFQVSTSDGVVLRDEINFLLLIKFVPVLRHRRCLR